jgi:Flp pilus assembly CpaE family ATPase
MSELSSPSITLAVLEQTQGASATTINLDPNQRSFLPLD